MLRKILTGLAVVTLTGAGLALLPVTPASGGGAPAITVDTTDDDGNLDACTGAPDDCSLRGALEGFASDQSTDVITDVTVPAGTYALLDEIRLFDVNVNVHGAGVGSTIVTTDFAENDLVRHLELNVDGTINVILSDMTFRDGAQSSGGSIRGSNGPHLVILRMHFLDNAARGDGGAIEMGGGLQGRTLIVEDTTFAGNTATEQGGAIHVGDNESADISNSTFTENAAAFGGALAVGDIEGPAVADAHLTFVTMSGNVSAGFQGDADIAGGSIAVGSGGEVFVEGSILEASAEGEVEAPGGPVAAAIGDPSAECYLSEGAVIESQDFNVVDDESCELEEAGDQINTAANAQPLADNGGPTFTMALLVESPAVDAAGATCDVEDDQRGVARPQDGNADATVACDVGAYELEATPETPPPPAVPVESTANFTG